MALRLWKLGLAAGLAAALGGSAQAGLLPLTATAVPDGNNFRYTYGVMLTSNSTLQKGDQFAIYDFNGFIQGSNTQPTGFSFNTVLTGGNPGRTVPNDNPAMPNLVWTYTGDTPLVGQIGLGNFTALSNLPEASVTTDFVSRTQVQDPNGDVRDEDNITQTKAPAGTDNNPPPVGPPSPPPVGPPSGVPEPSSLILLAAGLPLVAGVRAGRWPARRPFRAESPPSHAGAISLS
jgi:hypothetical protein